jgi:uncharacterized membrane protein
MGLGDRRGYSRRADQLAVRARRRHHAQCWIDFRDAPFGRGTLVTATIAYDSPAGPVGKVIAQLFQREPKIQARRGVRRFSRRMLLDFPSGPLLSAR